MKAIVIATTQNRSDWAKQCYDSLKGVSYPIIILDQFDYELGKIKWIYENTTLEEFLFLQDSVVIKDISFIEDLMTKDGSVSFSKRPFFMYLGKYSREDLERVGIPEVKNKKDAVFHEANWGKQITDKFLFELNDTNIFREHLGRMNMVIENEFLIKYKHIWKEDMIYDY